MVSSAVLESVTRLRILRKGFLLSLEQQRKPKEAHMNPNMANRVPAQLMIDPIDGNKAGTSPVPKGKATRPSRVSQQHAAALVHAISILTPNEQSELAACESLIEKGWETFVEVGRALARIRDQKLYRAHCDTFEAYCRERWQYGKSHV